MKSFMFRLIPLFFLGFLTACNANNQDTPLSANKVLVKAALRNVFENSQSTEETYAKYFSKDYIQETDGKTLNYKDFVAHLKALKSTMKSLKIDVQQMIAENDKVVSVHLARGIKKNGQTVDVKVIAVFQIKDHHIIRCDELTYLLKGSSSDRDLASRKM